MRTPREICLEYRSAIGEEGEKKGLGLSAAFMRDPRAALSTYRGFGGQVGPAQGYLGNADRSVCLVPRTK
jgi:hypothetical protein